MLNFVLVLVLHTLWVWCEDTTMAMEAVIPFPVCGNCKEVRNANRNSTGGFCHFEDGLYVIRIFEGENNSLPSCIPPTYDLSRSIRHFCCFWSPTLGCTMLIGPLYYQRFELQCDQCVPVCTNTIDDVGGSSAEVVKNIPLIILAIFSTFCTIMF
ncbi:uncharacterized protein Dana_GF27912 [Drosophila ananassae]|uniref:Uncharacterized protein n=1 Tax=Drosophila ananassae TaxID=7217 RepID=A0A0P8YC10_DROAN|nr:uncharacterized protein Dana_GF27912 [Drosophila ananassae]